MMPRRLMVRVIPLLLGGALVAGCGKKGPLIPPDALVPAPVSDLAVAQKGERFQVTWSIPSRQQGGAPLDNLQGFMLFRRPVLPPEQDCEECPSAYATLGRYDLDYLQGALRIGNKLLVEDANLNRGSSYQYKVRSYTRDRAQSRDSNLPRHTLLVPPPAPTLQAAANAASVTLTITAPAPEQGALVGYNIYRREAGEAEAFPLTRSPIKNTTFEDTQAIFGKRYSYRVTSIAEVNKETVESAPSTEVEAALVDPD